MFVDALDPDSNMIPTYQKIVASSRKTLLKNANADVPSEDGNSKTSVFVQHLRHDLRGMVSADAKKSYLANIAGLLSEKRVLLLDARHYS